MKIVRIVLTRVAQTKNCDSASPFALVYVCMEVELIPMAPVALNLACSARFLSDFDLVLDGPRRMQLIFKVKRMIGSMRKALSPRQACDVFCADTEDSLSEG